MRVLLLLSTCLSEGMLAVPKLKTQVPSESWELMREVGRGHTKGKGGSWQVEQFLPYHMPLNSISLLQ